MRSKSCEGWFPNAALKNPETDLAERTLCWECCDGLGADKRGDFDVRATDFKTRNKIRDGSEQTGPPRVAFNYSDVESETAREMVGARLGSPMHSKIFRVWIG
jgi:hypothetical protein